MPVARRWALVLALAAALLWPALAQAYVYYRMTKSRNLVRWPGNSIEFRVNTEGMPVGGAQAVQDSMNTWSNAGANLVMINAGEIASHAYGTRNYVNTIDYGELDENTLGECTWWNNSRGEMLDSDIRINQSYSWATNGDANSYDVQAVMTHEMGHTLPLGDLYGSGDRDKTMYGRTAKGDTRQRTLESDDINGVKFLYP